VVCNGGPKQHSYRLDAVVAMHDSSLLDMCSSCACLMPAAPSPCLHAACAWCSLHTATGSGQEGGGEGQVGMPAPGSRCCCCPSTTPCGVQRWPQAAQLQGWVQWLLCMTAACATRAAAVPVSCQQRLVVPTHSYWQRTRGGWGGTGRYASPWLTLLLLPEYYPLWCATVAPSSTATGLGAVVAMHDSSLRDTCSSRACLIPVAPCPCCLCLVPFTHNLWSTWGGWGGTPRRLGISVVCLAVGAVARSAGPNAHRQGVNEAASGVVNSLCRCVQEGCLDALVYTLQGNCLLQQHAHANCSLLASHLKVCCARAAPKHLNQLSRVLVGWLPWISFSYC
jgi:hypothetical protein